MRNKITTRTHKRFHRLTATPPPVNGTPIERVVQFKYLGRVVTEGGSDHAAVTKRISIAASTFYNLERRYFNARKVRVRTNVRIFQAIITAQLLYGCETWCLQRHMKVHISPDGVE